VPGRRGSIAAVFRRDRGGSAGDAALDHAVTAFVDDLTTLVQGMVGELPAQIAARLPGDIALEAQNLTLAVIDADGRHTDVELWAYLGAFAHRSDGSLQLATPDDVRRAGLAVGRRDWLTTASALFDLILTADARHRTTHAWTYYDRAMRLAHTVCALDSRPSDDELRAVDAFRSLLVDTMTARGIARPGSFGASWAPGRIPGGTPPDPSTGPSVVAGAVGSATAAAATAAPGAREELGPPEPIEDLLAELDGLVGLDGVKAEVRLVTNLLEIARIRRERDLPAVEGSRHLVFTGNPGTGKTTVARLLARIYRTLGVVERGHLVETDRAGLVAGYVGQTAIKVTEAFDRADQGVLLIDEAYALARGGERDFGREAIDTIVKLVEDRRDRIVVVAAGYPAEMAEFVDANPGLRSRFPKTIHFEDYTDEQLLAIFRGQCTKARYHPTDDAIARVEAFFLAIPRTKGFGNARLCRNVFEQAVANQASRLMELRRSGGDGAPPLTDDELLALTGADVPSPPPPDAIPSALVTS
jgi:hypothetical protein